MKTISTIFVVAALCISGAVQAQRISKWEFGVLADYGRDWYHKDYPPEINPEWVIEDFSTNRAWGTGVYFERLLNSHWSVLGQLSYAQKKLHPQLFHYYSQTASYNYLSETHHRAAFDAGVRWYLNPKSKLKFFADGKLGANVFLSAEQQEANFGRIVRSNVFGYQRVLSVASASVGLKWSRLTVSAEYRDDLFASKRVDKQTAISGRGVFGKVGIALVKSRR